MPNELKPEDVEKALECCLKADSAADCKKLDCPARTENGCFYEIDCEFYEEEAYLKKMLADALIIIREYRSQISVLKKLLARCETQFAEKDAEIERLQKHNTKMARKHYQDGRAEAITEFADRVCEGRVSNDPVVIAVRCAEREMKVSTHAHVE